MKTAEKAQFKARQRAQRGQLISAVAERMEQLNIESVAAFAEYADISSATLYNTMNGVTSQGRIVMPNHEIITKLARALGKPTHEVVYMLDPTAPGAEQILGTMMLPVYVAGQVGAGPQQLRATDDVVCVSRDWSKGRDLIAFQVVGNSMAGGRHPIYDGDRVIVDRRAEGELNGPVVARLVDDGYVCKRLRPGGILDSQNPEFDDPRMSLIAPDRVAEVVGRVVRIISALA